MKALVFAILILSLFPLAQAGEIEGSVIGIIRFERSTDADKLLTPEALKGSGWQKTFTHFQRVIVFEKVSIRINDTRDVPLSDDGRFYFSVEPGLQKIEVLNPHGQVIAVRELVTDEQTLRLPIVLTNDLEKHACCSAAAENKETQTDAPPCRDYNGNLGDCINYSSGWRKYTNFILSDCDYAMGAGYCWNELMPGVSCVHLGYTNCGYLIGHTSAHHCH